MNVTVLNVKDIFKFFLKLIIVISVIIILFIFHKKQNTIDLNKFSTMLKYCIASQVNIIDYNESKSKVFSLPQTILATEIRNINVVDNVEQENILSPETAKNEETENTKQKTVIGKNANTEEVTDNNIKPKYTNSYGTVQINNKTDIGLTEEMLEPNVNINKNNVAIYHTHTCESYTSSDEYPYTMTGNYRTTDLNYTVARVGTELEEQLKEKGFKVLHDTTYHDHPSYSGSYTRSLETIQNLIYDTDTDIVIDLHRDAVGSSNEYAPRIKVNGEYVAQLMFVMGTDQGGLEHPDWKENLKFAVLIQQKADEMYPGLFRPIILTKSRYNEHVGKAACIIECGATGNTLEECLLSMQCLANVFEEALK